MVNRKYVCVLDCEGTNTYNPYRTLVYDMGYTIIPAHGVITDACIKRSFAINEIIFNDELMQSAYYADKLPTYMQAHRREQQHTWRFVSFIDAWKQFIADCKEWGVSEVWAYNCSYDMRALNDTINYFSNGFVDSFLPDSIQWFDLWNAAKRITDTTTYIKWCYENAVLTDKSAPKTSVEAVAAYLYNNPSFVEQHTALDDAMHEAFIYQRIYRFGHVAKPKRFGGGNIPARNRAIAMGYLK